MIVLMTSIMTVLITSMMTVDDCIDDQYVDC